MTHTNFDNEIDAYHDDDKWWKVAATIIGISFFGYLIARSVVTLIWGV